MILTVRNRNSETMEFTLALTLFLALFIGISLGLLGGGGAILAVPVLTAVTGLDASHAIPTSLLIVGATSLVSLGLHAAKKRVNWQVGLIFGLAAMAGAFLGGRLGTLVPSPVLMLSFAAVMLAAAFAMIRGGRKAKDDAGSSRLPILKIILVGAAVGLVSGFVGAGGGFLIVPALTLLARFPMRTAVATSLLVITMQSAAGLQGYLVSVSIDWALAFAVAGIAVLGSFFGFWLAGRMPDRGLRKGFGWFVLVVALFVAGGEFIALLP